MGSRVFRGKKAERERRLSEKEKELIYIKNHPNRMRRRTSVNPDVPAIKEERLLEDLCDTTDIEPEVPGNNLGKKEIDKLIRKISISEKFTSKFQSDEDFLKHVRRLSDPQSALTSVQNNSRRVSLDVPSIESLDEYIRAIPNP